MDNDDGHPLRDGLSSDDGAVNVSTLRASIPDADEMECEDCDGKGYPKGKPDWRLGTSDETYGVTHWIARMNGLQSHLRIIAKYLPEDAKWISGQVEAAQKEAAQYVADYAPCPTCFGTGLMPRAKAMEARRAETLGSVHDSAVAKPFAQGADS